MAALDGSPLTPMEEWNRNAVVTFERSNDIALLQTEFSDLVHVRCPSFAITSFLVISNSITVEVIALRQAFQWFFSLRRKLIRTLVSPACGLVVCARCSPGTISLSQMGYVGPQRICEMCRQERARPRTKAKQCHPQPASPRDSAIHSLKPLSSEDAQVRVKLCDND